MCQSLQAGLGKHSPLKHPHSHTPAQTQVREVPPDYQPSPGPGYSSVTVKPSYLPHSSQQQQQQQQERGEGNGSGSSAKMVGLPQSGSWQAPNAGACVYSSPKV